MAARAQNRQRDDLAWTPRQAERRHRILTAVRRLIGAVGYANLSMRDVANEAGVAHATLYNLFETKDGLVLAALRDNLERIASDGESAGLTAVERYFRLLSLVADEVVDNPPYAEAMTHLLFNAAPSDGVTNLLLTQRVASDEEAVKDMIREGVLAPDLDAALLARRLTGTFWSTMLLWMKGFVALHDLRRELLTAHQAVLAAAATRAGKRRLAAFGE